MDPPVATDLVHRLLTADREGYADLGTTTAAQLRDAAREAAEGVAGADLFIALASHRRGEVTLPAAEEIVRAAGDVVAMIEIAGWLARGGTVPEPARRALGKAFLDRARDRGADYGSRSHALKAAMVLAQSERSLLLRLQAELLDLDLTDDGDFLRHAARIAGAVLAHEPDDGLRGLLARLVDVTEAEDEASMELGLDALRDGLDATTPDAALDAFTGARDWFRRAEATSDARPDAQLYHRCLDTLVAFQSGRSTPDLRARIEGIKASAFAYTAYLTSPDRDDETGSWLGAKGSERVHLSLLALRLSALDINLMKRAWLDAAAVIQDELLAVYSASRSLVRRAGDGGLEELLRPRIVGALQRELHCLNLLDQWMEENAASSLLPDAAALRAKVAAAREEVIGHRPIEAAAGSSPTAAIIELLPEGARPSALGRIAAGMVWLVEQTTSGVVTSLLERMTVELARNDDYRAYPDGRQVFDLVLWATVHFVAMRSDVGVSSLARGRYLFERDAAKLPLEKDLQADYHEFLMASPLAGICRAEPRDIGGGRVDILFTFTRTRTVAELKRTDLKLTNAEVVERFGLQKVSYDVTNVRYGILLVLDLHDLGGGQPHLSERISVHHVTPAWGTSEHAVALFRVQGRRVTPSRT